MKNLYAKLLLLVLITACKSTWSFATHPDKETYNSGTIGSVRVTDNPPNTNINTPDLKDTTIHKQR
jgi:hypothetical protein